MAKYNDMKKKYISEVKKKTNEYIFIVDIAVSVVYLAVLKLEKKELTISEVTKAYVDRIVEKEADIKKTIVANILKNSVIEKWF